MTYKNLIKNSDAANLVLLLALLVCIGLLVGYIRANRRLVVQAEVLKNQAEAFEIRSGDFWPPLSAVNANGATVPLISGDSQLVLVESKTCKVCLDMQAQWASIANEAAQEHCRVRTISLDPNVAAHAEAKESFEVIQLTVPSEFTRARLELTRFRRSSWSVQLGELSGFI